MGRMARLFPRLFLPALAFKAAVIGGGYATGRELASFFLPSGAWGGVYAIFLVAGIWSGICALTFLFAHRTGSLDYRTFFRHLLGPFWPLYEIGWILAVLVILAVFAAAAGEIGAALFAWPRLAGTLLFLVLASGYSGAGGRSVEGLFKWVSVLLYLTYAALIFFLLSRFGGAVGAAFSRGAGSSGWVQGGVAYAGYNMIGAIVILPVTRHFTSGRDAIVSGLLCGPLAMIPALLFFLGMVAFAPEIRDVALPSDFLLQRLDMPWFRLLFQVMIFCALLESGTSGLHAINERVAQAYRTRRGRELPQKTRLALSVAVLVGAVFVAGQFGLVALVARGYVALSCLFIAVYVVPLLTYGVWLLSAGRYRKSAESEANLPLSCFRRESL
jgi:uncharacterized membrane protein YkvI